MSDEYMTCGQCTRWDNLNTTIIQNGYEYLAFYDDVPGYGKCEVENGINGRKYYPPTHACSHQESWMPKPINEADESTYPQY